MQKYQRRLAFIEVFAKKPFRFFQKGIVRFFSKSVIERLGLIHICVFS